LVQEAFSILRDEYIKAWRSSPARDTEGREQLWLLLKVVDRVESHLRQAVESGKIAKQELVHRQSMVDRARTWAQQQFP
jgi:hypothetical protein